MSLVSIRLELGRTASHPYGDPHYGYEFVAPLDRDGHLDTEAWRQQKDRCAVRRFRPGESERKGNLCHNGKTWLFDYVPERQEDDATLLRLDRHLLEKGLSISITEEDGVQRPFKIVGVRPLEVQA